MIDSPVRCTIDLAGPGKQIGHLAFPKITNTAGWATQHVHIGSVANGEGPTVLVLGGNHGDEYEGQVAALRLP
ncbi:MAG: deacylase, partial [Variovorax sp.]